MKVTVGDVVTAPARLVHSKAAGMYFGNEGAKAKELSGTVTGTSGHGRKIRYVVRWTDDRFPPSEHTSRTLTPKVSEPAEPDTAAPPEAELTTPGPAGAVGQPDAAPQAAVPEEPPPTNDKLQVKHVRWVIDENLEDPRAHLTRQTARIHWGESARLLTPRERRCVDYMMWSFPQASIPGILSRTTASMLAINHKTKPLTKGEFFRVIGFLLALTRTQKRRRDLFSLVDGLFPAPAFGKRYGISRNRLDMILRHLSIGPTKLGDRAHPINDFIRLFNECRYRETSGSMQYCESARVCLY